MMEKVWNQIREALRAQGGNNRERTEKVKETGDEIEEKENERNWKSGRSEKSCVAVF